PVAAPGRLAATSPEARHRNQRALSQAGASAGGLPTPRVRGGRPSLCGVGMPAGALTPALSRTDRRRAGARGRRGQGVPRLARIVRGCSTCDRGGWRRGEGCVLAEWDPLVLRAARRAAIQAGGGGTISAPPPPPPRPPPPPARKAHPSP